MRVYDIYERDNEVAAVAAEGDGRVQTGRCRRAGDASAGLR